MDRTNLFSFTSKTKGYRFYESIDLLLNELSMLTKIRWWISPNHPSDASSHISCFYRCTFRERSFLLFFLDNFNLVYISQIEIRQLRLWVRSRFSRTFDLFKHTEQRKNTFPVYCSDPSDKILISDPSSIVSIVFFFTPLYLDHSKILQSIYFPPLF